MIGSSYNEFNPYDWDSGYNQAIKDFTKYIQEKKGYYADGLMCSMSESVVGESVCDDILKYLDELSKR